MSSESLTNLPSIIEQVYKAILLLFALGWKFRQRVLNVITVIVAAEMARQTWFTFDRSPILFFMGPPGTVSASMGKQIASRIAKTRDPSGLDYVVVTEHVNDLVAIRDRMAAELNHIPLGIVEDSQTHESNELRALLPLQWEYLFVLCRSEFAREWKKNHDGKRYPSTLSDVMPEFDLRGKKESDGEKGSDQKKGRLLLWSEGTMSCKLGTLALKKFGDPKIQHHAKGITTWREMRTAFRNDEIDLAFCSARIASEYIREIAEDPDKAVVLLGLGDIEKAIQLEQTEQVYAAELPLNFGRASNPDSASSDEPPFCPDNLKTIAARRVLACMKTLPIADAYLLADAARYSLIDEGIAVDFTGEDGPANGKGAKIRMEKHPALEMMIKNEKPVVLRDPSTWSPWIRAAVGVFVALLFLDGLRFLTKKLTAPEESSVNGVVESSTIAVEVDTDHERIDCVLVGYENMIDERTHQEIADELSAWDERFRDLRRDIHRSVGLTDAQRESLWQRYRRLAFEVETSPHWANNLRKQVKSGGTSSGSSTGSVEG